MARFWLTQLNVVGTVVDHPRLLPVRIGVGGVTLGLPTKYVVNVCSISSLTGLSTKISQYSEFIVVTANGLYKR